MLAIINLDHEFEHNVHLFYDGLAAPYGDGKLTVPVSDKDDGKPSQRIYSFIPRVHASQSGKIQSDVI